MNTATWKPQIRSVQTTVPCLLCGASLEVVRLCHDVLVRCQACGHIVAIQDVIARADESMEHFLDSVYCDRM